MLVFPDEEDLQDPLHFALRRSEALAPSPFVILLSLGSSLKSPIMTILASGSRVLISSMIIRFTRAALIRFEEERDTPPLLEGQ